MEAWPPKVSARSDPCLDCGALARHGKVRRADHQGPRPVLVRQHYTHALAADADCRDLAYGLIPEGARKAGGDRKIRVPHGLRARGPSSDPLAVPAARAAAIGLTNTLASAMAITRPKTCLLGCCSRCAVDGIWVSLSPVTCNLPVLEIEQLTFIGMRPRRGQRRGKPRPVVPTLNSHQMLSCTMHRSRLPTQGRVAGRVNF